MGLVGWANSLLGARITRLTSGHAPLGGMPCNGADMPPMTMFCRALQHATSLTIKVGCAVVLCPAPRSRKDDYYNYKNMASDLTRTGSNRLAWGHATRFQATSPSLVARPEARTCGTTWPATVKARSPTHHARVSAVIHSSQSGLDLVTGDHHLTHVWPPLTY